MVFQESVAGVYRPPFPPQTIISVPVQTAECGPLKAAGQLGPVDVVVHVSESGLYRPPVLVFAGVDPPQMIISIPVQTAVWLCRGEGQLDAVDVAIQVSADGRYLPPSFL